MTTFTDLTRTQILVQAFHTVFGHPIADRPALVDDELAELRLNLLEEEFLELTAAIADGDLVEIADALGDIQYILDGTALAYGIGLNPIVEEIHRSNLSKLGADGLPVRREDGKILKGPNYSPPQLAPILRDQGALL